MVVVAEGVKGIGGLMEGELRKRRRLGVMGFLNVLMGKKDLANQSKRPKQTKIHFVQRPSKGYLKMRFCDLRVQSFSGMLELMWMLSIQMCPRVPCAKNPSITTCRGAEGKRERKRRKLRKEEETA